MAKFMQFKVWKSGKEGELPLILTFTNMKRADEFDTWCLINRRKYERNGPYKLFTSPEQAIDELKVWER
jgi:hypothetical protein